ncbi:hypothetical protein ACFQHV_05145 [Promicromonospora thailandica]|uniref:hypothetical protein n=1 Tax=Promicromonospora thailandica TaxID=765201 RepID=UPI0020A31155|nr:hypothetical protein [Promicromonospora thailandica]
MRAVILPATPLLVPGLVPGLCPDPLAAVRDAVRVALSGLVGPAGGRADGDPLPLVVAHGPALRHARLRPSLAASGIGDRWLPRSLAAPVADDDTTGPAGTGASVALLALSDVLGARAAAVETLEVPPSAETFDDATTALLHAAAGLVVAGGGSPGAARPGHGDDSLTPGLRAALRLAGAGAWTADVRTFPQSHGHLPAAYHVTTLS